MHMSHTKKNSLLTSYEMLGVLLEPTRAHTEISWSRANIKSRLEHPYKLYLNQIKQNIESQGAEKYCWKCRKSFCLKVWTLRDTSNCWHEQLFAINPRQRQQENYFRLVLLFLVESFWRNWPRLMFLWKLKIYILPSRLGRKRKEKNSVHNLPYGPRTRLIWGMYCMLKYVVMCRGDLSVIIFLLQVGLNIKSVSMQARNSVF